MKTPLLTLSAILAFSLPVVASETFEARDVEMEIAIFGFAGALTKDDMGNSVNPFGVDYERNLSAGAGMQVLPFRHGAVSAGVEVGVGVRAGHGARTHDAWTGPVVRHDGWTLGDTVTIAPSFTAGISVVDAAHPGRETRLVEARNGNAGVLFYLGPQIGVSTTTRPELETFWRLHHRSGAGGTLGDMHGAKNANVIGVRRRF